jgi:hypothetical protein
MRLPHRYNDRRPCTRRRRRRRRSPVGARSGDRVARLARAVARDRRAADAAAGAVAPIVGRADVAVVARRALERIGAAVRIAEPDVPDVLREVERERREAVERHAEGEHRRRDGVRLDRTVLRVVRPDVAELDALQADADAVRARLAVPELHARVLDRAGAGPVGDARGKRGAIVRGRVAGDRVEAGAVDAHDVARARARRRDAHEREVRRRVRVRDGIDVDRRAGRRDVRRDVARRPSGQLSHWLPPAGTVVATFFTWKFAPDGAFRLAVKRVPPRLDASP